MNPTPCAPAVADLLARPAAMPLGPGTPDRAAADTLRKLDVATAFAPGTVRDAAAARACLAGLWLRFNHLDASHDISQELHTPEGSFWHAVMHRREPDAWNSKYWWRKVGHHPVLDQLVEQSRTLGYAYTTPADFVDFCERVRGRGGPDEELAKGVQLLEWQLLFDHCHRLAVGG